MSDPFKDTDAKNFLEETEKERKGLSEETKVLSSFGMSDEFNQEFAKKYPDKKILTKNGKPSKFFFDFYCSKCTLIQLEAVNPAKIKELGESFSISLENGKAMTREIETQEKREQIVDNAIKSEDLTKEVKCPLCGAIGNEIAPDYYACANHHEFDKGTTKEEIQEHLNDIEKDKREREMIKTMNSNDYIKLLVKAGKTTKQIEELVQAKKEELKGLISEEGALFMITKELGIDIVKREQLIDTIYNLALEKQDEIGNEAFENSLINIPALKERNKILEFRLNFLYDFEVKLVTIIVSQKFPLSVLDSEKVLLGAIEKDVMAYKETKKKELEEFNNKIKEEIK